MKRAFLPSTAVFFSTFISSSIHLQSLKVLLIISSSIHLHRLKVLLIISSSIYLHLLGAFTFLRPSFIKCRPSIASWPTMVPAVRNEINIKHELLQDVLKRQKKYIRRYALVILFTVTISNVFICI